MFSFMKNVVLTKTVTILLDFTHYRSPSVMSNTAFIVKFRTIQLLRLNSACLSVCYIFTDKTSNWHKAALFHI